MITDVTDVPHFTFVPDGINSSRRVSFSRRKCNGETGRNPDDYLLPAVRLVSLSCEHICEASSAFLEAAYGHADQHEQQAIEVVQRVRR